MIRRIEELSMSAWPALQTHLYDGWVLRTSRGYTKRANSVSLLYKSNLELNQKINYCKDYYERQHLPIIYKITSDAKLFIIDEKLKELGYSKIDETSVQLLDLKQLTIGSDSESEVSYHLTQEWIDGFSRSAGIKDVSIKDTLSLMLHNIIGKTLFITHKVKGITVGYGYGVVDHGYVGIYDIYVNEQYRGNHYGKAVMNKILETACQMGAHSAYLQVVVGNTVAEKLYERLGFKEIYRYWYRKL